jgi:hypothetical protein
MRCAPKQLSVGAAVDEKGEWLFDRGGLPVGWGRSGAAVMLKCYAHDRIFDASMIVRLGCDSYWVSTPWSRTPTQSTKTGPGSERVHDWNLAKATGRRPEIASIG